MAAFGHNGDVPAETVVSRGRPTGGQRERLLEAVVALVTEFGYSEVKIGQLVARADVSRQAFYRLFADKESCCLAALSPATETLLAEVRSATLSGEPCRATAVAVQTLVAFAAAEPELPLLVAGESLRGGPRVWRAREQLFTSLAGIISDAHSRARRDEPFPDLPPRLACGVTCRMVASRLRQNTTVADLPGEIGAWLTHYESPLAEHRWDHLASSFPADRSPFVPRRALVPPPAESRPRGGAAKMLADEDWLRITFATAEIVDRDGYESATIGEIVSRAGVDPRVLLRHIREQATGPRRSPGAAVPAPHGGRSGARSCAASRGRRGCGRQPARSRNAPSRTRFSPASRWYICAYRTRQEAASHRM